MRAILTLAAILALIVTGACKDPLFRYRRITRQLPMGQFVIGVGCLR